MIVDFNDVYGKVKKEVGEGILQKFIPAHECQCPSAWLRFWHGVEDQDIWTCGVCTQQWKWCVSNFTTNKPNPNWWAINDTNGKII